MLALGPNLLTLANAEAQTDPASLANAVLVSESGEAVRLADYRGKVVFVNFWGSWCLPCLQEMSSIRALQARLADLRNDVAFVFISAKPGQFQSDSAWLRSNGIAGANYRWSGSLPGLSVPTTLVLDPTGAVAQYRNQAVEWEVHADTIRGLLTLRSHSVRS
jgi:thiol-disulfide isomerase/thioredoxin